MFESIMWVGIVVGAIGYTIYRIIERYRDLAKREAEVKRLKIKYKIYLYNNRPDLQVFEAQPDNYIVNLDGMINKAMTERKYHDA